MEDFQQYIRTQLADANLDAVAKQFFLSSRPAVIYGAGDQCRLAIDFCHYFHKPVECLLISPGGRRCMPYWQDIPMYVADENLPPSVDRQSDVILALHEKHHPSVISRLQELGFTTVYAVDHWEEVNQRLRDIWFESYFRFHNFSLHTDMQGERFWSAPPPSDVQARLPVEYRLYYPQNDPVILSNIMGELNDIVLPSLTQDYSYLCEGAYEYDHVQLAPDDVVLDLGANLGLFSGVAAAKGCQVYAFEPTPLTITYLRKNLSFYEHVRIRPYAVCDRSGTVTFKINADLNQDMSLGSNSMCPRQGYKHDHWKSITVESISIDDFVRREHLDRVDFIKADIEGAERLMLQGARQTLARFAPKLALCTYHLQDDPQVMERLILDANPRYTIVHKWSKLYAWCQDA